MKHVKTALLGASAFIAFMTLSATESQAHGCDCAPVIKDEASRVISSINKRIDKMQDSIVSKLADVGTVIATKLDQQTKAQEEMIHWQNETNAELKRQEIEAQIVRDHQLPAGACLTATAGSKLALAQAKTAETAKQLIKMNDDWAFGREGSPTSSGALTGAASTLDFAKWLESQGKPDLDMSPPIFSLDKKTLDETELAAVNQAIRLVHFGLPPQPPAVDEKSINGPLILAERRIYNTALHLSAKSVEMSAALMSPSADVKKTAAAIFQGLPEANNLPDELSVKHIMWMEAQRRFANPNWYATNSDDMAKNIKDMTYMMAFQSYVMMYMLEFIEQTASHTGSHYSLAVRQAEEPKLKDASGIRR